MVGLVPRGFLEFRVGSEAVGKLNSFKTVCVGKRMDKQRGLLVLDKTNRGPLTNLIVFILFVTDKR